MSRKPHPTTGETPCSAAEIVRAIVPVHPEPVEGLRSIVRGPGGNTMSLSGMRVWRSWSDSHDPHPVPLPKGEGTGTLALRELAVALTEGGATASPA